MKTFSRGSKITRLAENPRKATVLIGRTPLRDFPKGQKSQVKTPWENRGLCGKSSEADHLADESRIFQISDNGLDLGLV